VTDPVPVRPTPKSVVPCELVLQTTAGERRHPINVLAIGHHLSAAEGFTITMDTRTEVHGFRIEMPTDSWATLMEANHPGLLVSTAGVRVVTVIENTDRYVLGPGDTLAIHDDLRLPPPTESEQIALLEAKIANLEDALWQHQERMEP
jgi:hypothetical protein